VLKSEILEKKREKHDVIKSMQDMAAKKQGVLKDLRLQANQ